MTPSEFKTELKHLAGGYLFYGEEDYLKKYYFAAARDLVTDKDDIFNRVAINADNYSPSLLMSSVESLPVMSEKRFIELSGISFSNMKDSELDELIEVLSRLPEYEYNVLIIMTDRNDFDAGTAKAPSKLLKRLSEVLKPVSFPRETPARLAAWVTKHFTAELIVAAPDAVNALLARCGCDMSVLSLEIEKLCWYLKGVGRDKLTEKDVAYVASESKEIAAFDFTNAIIDGRVDVALYILNDMRLKKEKPEIVLSSITKVICDISSVKALLDSGLPSSSVSEKLGMHSYKAGIYIKSASRTDSDRLRQLVEICYEADKKIKLTQLDKYAVLDRLTVEAAVR